MYLERFGVTTRSTFNVLFGRDCAVLVSEPVERTEYGPDRPMAAGAFGSGKSFACRAAVASGEGKSVNDRRFFGCGSVCGGRK